MEADGTPVAEALEPASTSLSLSVEAVEAAEGEEAGEERPEEALDAEETVDAVETSAVESEAVDGFEIGVIVLVAALRRRACRRRR